MARQTIDIGATLKKLQTNCEEKIRQLEELQQVVAEKEKYLKEISNIAIHENLAWAQTVHESASLKLELAKLMVEVEKQNKISEEYAVIM